MTQLEKIQESLSVIKNNCAKASVSLRKAAEQYKEAAEKIKRFNEGVKK